MKTDKNIEISMKLDIREEVCPYTFIRTKLAMEQMKSGEIIEVTMKGTAIDNVPRSVKDEGHSIVHVEKEDECIVFYIQKNGE